MEWYNDDDIDMQSNETTSDVLELRDWQRKAKKFFYENDCKSIFEIATGSGKTYISIDIINEIINKEPKTRVLVVVPKNVILETGWYKELVDFGIPIQKIGIYYGNIKEYAQITLTNMQSVKRIPVELFDFAVFDECFSGDTKVWVVKKDKNGSNGYLVTSTSIRYLVDHKLKTKVVSFNINSKTFELKNIKNWYKIKNEEKLIKINFKNAMSIKVTKNQLLYTGEKYIEANNVKKGDKLLYFGLKNTIMDTNLKKQLIISGILGDGHINVIRKKARIKYSCIHKEYMILKHAILSEFENTKVKKIMNCGYKKAYIYRYDSTMYTDLYDFNKEYLKKGVDFLLDQINDIGIAFWCYDDGSSTRNSFMLHTNSFSYADNIKIKDFFIKIGYDCRIQSQTKKDGRTFYSISFRKSGAEKIHNLLKKIPLKCYEYKYNFSNKKQKYINIKDRKYFNIESLNNLFNNYLRSDKRCSYSIVESVENVNSEKYVYDLEVEDNHNFFANDILSHNCHNYASERLLEVVKYPFKYKLGLTATLKRLDNRHVHLLKAFNYNIFKYNAREALYDSVLNPFIFYNIGVEMDSASLETYKTLTHELNTFYRTYGNYGKIMSTGGPIKNKMLALMNERKQLVNNYATKFNVAFEIIKKHKQNKIIVFNQFNDQTSKLYWYLLEDDIDCRVVHSGVSNSKREQALMDFKNDKYNVLLASKVLDEGYNLPKLDMAIIMAGDSSEKQPVQRMGRVLRKKEGIDSILIQIYCKGTFEERDSNMRAKLFKGLASSYTDIDYVDGDEINLV